MEAFETAGSAPASMDGFRLASGSSVCKLPWVYFAPRRHPQPRLPPLPPPIDDRHLYIVMDLCEGGELLERLVQRGHFAETDACTIMAKIFETLKVGGRVRDDCA